MPNPGKGQSKKPQAGGAPPPHGILHAAKAGEPPPKQKPLKAENTKKPKGAAASADAPKAVQPLFTSADAAPDSHTLALAIMSESYFAAHMTEGRAKALASELLDEPPTSVDFQQLHQVDAPKAVQGPAQSDAMADEVYFKEIFCILHGGFVAHSGTDIDHADPFAHFLARQRSLLTFLRDNPKYTAAFLDESKNPGIQDYFRKDPKDGLVKGTKLFYKVTYNDADNVWLLCHACNITKSNEDFETWAGKQERLGPEFVAALKAAGGIHQGITLQSVRQPDAKAIVDSSGVKTHLSPDPARKGLGRFIRDWYVAHHQKAFAIHKRYYRENYGAVKAELAEIRTIKDNAKRSEKLRALDKLVTGGKGAAKGSKRARQTVGDSSSDDDATAADREKAHEESARITDETFHDMKALKKWIVDPANKVDPTIVTGIRERLTKGMIFRVARILDRPIREQVCDHLKDFLSNVPADAPAPKPEDVLGYFQNMLEHPHLLPKKQDAAKMHDMASGVPLPGMAKAEISASAEKHQDKKPKYDV